MTRESRESRTIAPSLRIGFRAALLLTLTGTTPPLAGAGGSPDDPCPLCRQDPGVPIVRLTAADLDSVAGAHAAFNETQLALINALLEAGAWGASGEPAAQRTARLFALLSLSTTYRDLGRWALAMDRIYELEGSALAGTCARYTDGSLFLGPRLSRVRIGCGRACVRYALEEPGEGESSHGGRRLRWKVRDARIEGKTRRVLDVTMSNGQDGEVRFLFSSHYTMAVSYERFPGPSPFEWFLVHDIEGAWIRKWGNHRPTAFMLWRSTLSPNRTAGTRPAPFAPAAFPPPELEGVPELPAEPLLGVRVYVPDLRLRLPLLPDVHVEDLREAEVIMPILDLDYLRRGDQPPWLELNTRFGFRNWQGLGAVPPEIRERFPDR